MIFFGCQFCHLLAIDQAAEPANRGFVLLLVLVVLLGGFFIGVLLLNLARRNRRKTDEARRLAERETKGHVDPWFEAGRRAAPVDGSPDQRTGSDESRNA